MTAEKLAWEAEVAAQLRALDEAGLRRHLRLAQRREGNDFSMDGCPVVNFASNDYLGLAVCEDLKRAMMVAVARYGVGSGASRLVCGSMPPHQALEIALADFKQTEAALTFSSGHAVSVGVLPALCGSGDTIILDKLSHASLIDGARLSGAVLRVFPHNNVEKLEKMLRSIRAKDATGRILLVTESVFSMDGDAAPLASLVELKDRYGAWLLVDEAHAFGILGPQGRGLVAELGLEKRVELQMGTLSKAAGVSGGYVAASRQVIDLLVNRARSLIYSTAPSPAVAATAAASVALIAGEEGERRRRRLWANRELLLSLLPQVDAVSVMAAIVPLVIGGEREALEAAEALRVGGFLAPAIRYPTVSRGQARLRVTLSALHEPFQIEGLVGCLRRNLI
jgi:8-amino-7-oxononanoate synthase